MAQVSHPPRQQQQQKQSQQQPQQPPKGLWDSVKKKGVNAGKRASLVTHKAKIRADMMKIDKNIVKRKQALGVDLYDSLVLHAESDPVFIIESDSLDHIRGEFVTCFKDNKALLQQRARRQQQLVEVDEQREVAYPKIPCATVVGQLKNGCKAANFARQEVGCKNKIALVEDNMKKNKQLFGEEVYKVLVRLEDRDKWLPGDRDIRFLYDQARRDVTTLISEKQQKVLELATIGSNNS